MRFLKTVYADIWSGRNLMLAIVMIAVVFLIVLTGCRAAATTGQSAGTKRPTDSTRMTTTAKSATTTTAAATTKSTTTTNAAATTPTGTTQAFKSERFPQLEYAIRSTFPDPFPARDDFRIIMEKATYPVGTEKVAFTMENRTAHDMLTGEPYMLEVRTGNTWHSVPYRKLPDNVYRAWIAIAYKIPANGSWSHVIHLSEHVGVEPGRYRLVKEIQSGIFISTEFSIA